VKSFCQSQSRRVGFQQLDEVVAEAALDRNHFAASSDSEIYSRPVNEPRAMETVSYQSLLLCEIIPQVKNM
jgi:hypothetical protein